jgi:SAM-dependent methyltransferase
MPNYQKIYNEIFQRDAKSIVAEKSSGFRNVVQSTDQLVGMAGRTLDIGCGKGFVIQYLADRPFHLHPHGVDVSDLAIEQARVRMSKIPNAAERIQQANCTSLPFEDNFFALATCFDVLHEISRVVRQGGMFFGSVSCGPSNISDSDGISLHRTVKSPDWWIETMKPDRATFDGYSHQLTIWKRAPFGDDSSLFNSTQANVPVSKVVADHPADSKDLYQKIYDENPWYGDADEGRCPGVRLLPQYQDWLIGPVIDLGCGRGHTVERLRELGFEASGIDQISKHPDMLVGDITKPIKNLSRFQTAVCVDCIEHLYDEQVHGLFANMKQVQRQAFSIHNGESTGTGQELHVNRRPFAQWRKIIERNFVIEKEIELHGKQMLYLTSSK